jgi:hypothetical protein
VLLIQKPKPFNKEINKSFTAIMRKVRTENRTPFSKDLRRNNLAVC